MNSNTDHISKKRKKSTRTNLDVAMDIYECSFQNEAFDAYFDWLKEQIMSDDIDELDDYGILITTLSVMPFTYVVEMDSNRMWDGLYLRNIFYDDHAAFEGELTQDCSLLEMLVGLAYRMANDVFSDLGKSTGDWFWEFMSNLGADYYTDDILEGVFTKNHRNYRDDLIDLLRNFMDRKYKDSRSGNIFLFKKDPKDLKKIELWYQMHYYIEQKYGF